MPQQGHMRSVKEDERMLRAQPWLPFLSGFSLSEPNLFHPPFPIPDQVLTVAKLSSLMRMYS